MGMAEVVPGVSGGTIALITGIYEKLIYTIKSVDKDFIIHLFSGQWKKIQTDLDLGFLFSLMLGMLMGIVIGVFGISYLFENYPEPLWGFFFGLILASCIYVGKKVKKWEFSHIGILLIGLIIAYGITVISPAEGNTSSWYVFTAGMIAICALILPGISGSFILLLMGMYTVIIPTLKNFLSSPNLSEFWIIVVFGSGCLVGLLGFSRIMNYLFNRFPDKTLVLLVGFMLGSLNKIWPWRNVSEILSKESYSNVFVTDLKDLESYIDGGYKVLKESNVLPGAYWMSSPKVYLTIGAFILGFLVLFFFDLMANRFQKKTIV